MCRICQYNFIPNIFAIFVQKIRTHNFHIWILFIYSSFRNLSHTFCLFDSYYTQVLWPPSRGGTLLSHSASSNFGTNYNYSLFCLVSKSVSLIQSTGLFDSMYGWFFSPANGFFL